MVFIIHGRILLQHIRRWSKTPANGVPPGEDELELESGAWWGEACFFEQGRVRDFNAFAAVESELAVLPAHEYHRVLQLYPQQAALHRALEQGIHSGRLSLDDLAFKPRRKSLLKERGSSMWMQIQGPKFMHRPPAGEAAAPVKLVSPLPGVCTEE